MQGNKQLRRMLVADVRSSSGVPAVAAFGGITTQQGTPLIVDTATGNLYVLTTGDVVTHVGIPIPATLPVVTGSRGGNAALASLLTALAGLGLITNSTSA